MMITETLFTRDGAAVDPARTLDTDNGKAGYFVRSACTRCGGAGGFKGWPGFTCYRCGGVNSRAFEVAFVRVYTAEKLAKLNASQAKRDAKRAAVAAAAAVEAAAVAARFDAAHAALIARAARFLNVEAADDSRTSAIVKDIIRKGRAAGSLTDKQRAAVEAMCTAAEAHDVKAATLGYVGTVGARIELAVTVVRVASFERPVYMGYGAMQTVHVVTMADPSGNEIVSKSPSFREEVGRAFILRATVKEHGEYKGVKQTVVSRPVARDGGR